MADIDVSQFTMSFDDDFESLDLQINNGTWRTSFNDSETGRTHGDELQIYVDYSYLGLNINPFSITDGVLSIHAAPATAEITAATGYDYTSGMLSSRGTYSQTYGYFEIKCDAPEVAGSWPAFWLLPANGSWPPELDVFETLGSNTSKVYTTVHTAEGGTHEMQGISSAMSGLSDGMHTYGVLWTKDDLVWYIDGEEVYRTATPSDMHQPMYMITNLAVGGWAGDPGADFSGADYKVDHIRAYTLESTPYPNIITSEYSFTLDKVANGLILTGTADITGTGNALDNTITGNSGNNILDGAAGTDTMAGGLGNDSYYVDNAGDVVTEWSGEGTDKIFSSISLTLVANVENLTLTGSANINATGNELNNTLTGNAGNNILDGGIGVDTMVGGAGDDTYYIDDTRDVVTDWSGCGTDTVISSVTYTLTTSAENLTLTGTSDLNATGNWLNNVLTGNDGSNVLDGSTGTDTMVGGAGDDIYYVDNAGDVVTEALNAGYDTVITSLASYTLGDNVEKLVLTSTWSGSAIGNALNNSLTGNAAANTIDGGTGADVMIGGAGDDTYYVDNSGDTVTEWSGEGTDTVNASVSFALLTQAENLKLTGTANIDATGNELANTLTGNSGNNVLDGGTNGDTLVGGLGNDTYYVDDTRDVVTEWSSQGTDNVYASVSYSLLTQTENLTLTGTTDINATGNGLSNTLTGNAGDNILDGGTSADTMAGAAGSDTYYVDNTGDVVTEGVSAGYDTVIASLASYTLGDNVEKLVLTSAWSGSAIGNALNNSLTGNAAANTIDGGTGTDAMIGGAGDDTYYVDNAGDTVTEWSGEGTDTVNASVSFALLTQAENLKLTGTANIDATGNELANTLTGNSGNNVLDGGANGDTLVGGLGNDTYYVDDTRDVITEWSSQGTDSVYASVSYTLLTQTENLTLTGTANINGTGNGLANTLTGNDGNNSLDGGASADTLVGGLGADVLTGGTGNDRFVFANISDSTSGGRDTIADFATGDSIDLSGVFDGTLRYLHTGAFTGTAGEVQIATEGSGVVVNIDTNGDLTADMQIYLQNITTSSLTSSGANFIL